MPQRGLCTCGNSPIKFGIPILGLVLWWKIWWQGVNLRHAAYEVGQDWADLHNRNLESDAIPQMEHELHLRVHEKRTLPT